MRCYFQNHIRGFGGKKNFYTSADILAFFNAPFYPRGVDLHNRALEVKRLFYAGFGKQVVREGYDPDDVLQEIYQGILARNKGVNPYNPEVSSFGHYVHMVCRSVWFNYRDKMQRIASRSGTVKGSVDSEDYGDVDAATVAVDESYNTEPQIIIRHLLNQLPETQRVILQSIMEGNSPRATATEYGIRWKDIQKTLQHARTLLGDSRMN
jgi:RNA polymerase sigma factor (sigma-70 family)